MPSMGWLYGDLEKAKNDLAIALNNKESRYLPIWKILDTRWENKLSTPLHRAGYFFNPYFYYSKREEIERDGKYMKGVIECMSRMFARDEDMQDKISEQLPFYQVQEGSFGTPMAKRQGSNASINPVNWWKQHGTDAPNLRVMALRILSLTTSSSGCERNWSTFEMIHTKRRNRLGHKRLNDLVFVKFNAKLKTKMDNVKKDPLAARTFDEGKVTEWMVPLKGGNALDEDDEEDDEVFPGEALTWKQVERAMDADPDPRRSSRHTMEARATKRAKTGSSSKGKRASHESEEEEEIGSSSDSSEEDEPNLALDDYDTSESERERGKEGDEN